MGTDFVFGTTGVSRVPCASRGPVYAAVGVGPVLLWDVEQLGQGPRGGESNSTTAPQKYVHQKWPDQIFPTVNFVFSHDGPFGLEGGGSTGGGGGALLLRCTTRWDGGDADAGGSPPPSLPPSPLLISPPSSRMEQSFG